MKYDERACKFNMDTGCVELLLRDGRKISIDCTGVEDALDVTMAQQTELDYLIYNRLEQLLEGDMNENDRQGGNMKRTKFYVCPHCGNVLTASAEAQISCCGKNLTPLEAKKADDTHRLTVELIENEYYLTAAHPQTREHSLAFAALLTGDTLILRRLYPEWDVQTRIPRLGHGQLYFYCTQDGLFVQNL